MIKWLFRLVLLLALGLLAYNYFLDSKNEKDQSRAILQQMKQLGNSFSELLISEKEKFDAGKYHEASDKIGAFVEEIKTHSASLSNEEKVKLDVIEQKQIELKQQIEQTENLPAEEGDEQKKKLHQQLEELLRDADDFLRGLE